jgi:hypothetical protein
MPQRPGESDDAYERRVRIENMETDTAQKLQQIELAAKQFSLEQRKALWQAFAAGAAFIVAVAALVRLVLFHQ